MLTPWWQVLQLRSEVADSAGNIDDVQMSLFRTVYSDRPPRYSDPIYYGSITHPTATLAGLMARIAVRLGGGSRYTSANALYHLDQGMGGGKSHGLIGLYHLAHEPDTFMGTEIGQKVLDETKSRLGGIAPNLANTHVVVISADHMTPFAPDDRSTMDGPAKTLWERFLWRLVSGDYTLYSRYRERWDQEGIKEALSVINRPILILVDEIMDYMRQLADTKYEGQRNSELSFLKSLFDVVNDVPHVAMVVVMIATDRDKATYEGLAQKFRDELQSYIVRNGKNTAVTEAGDFSQIIRRRLFEAPAPSNVIAATVEQFTTISPQWRTVLNRVPGADPASFAAEVARSYPFHPDLLRLVETEWATLAGYQRVRSTVSLFAQTAYVWFERAKRGEWAPLLIGPGDLPLENSGVREALLGAGIIESDTTIANYRQVIATDIVGEGGVGGVAATMDRERAGTTQWKNVNPRAAHRMATALLLYSLAPRAGGKVGATESELKAASLFPDQTYSATEAETVLNELTDPDKGLGALDKMAGSGGQSARYQLTTRQTLLMLFRVQRSAITEKDRDTEVALTAEILASVGAGFSKKRFVRNELNSQGQPRSDSEIMAELDERDTTRLVVLDPSRWTLLNGLDDETREAIRMAFGVGSKALPVTHAASMVIACVNTQRRNQARQRAADYLAWIRVSRIQIVADDTALHDQAESEARTAKVALEKEVKRAFQHYAYLIRDAQEQLEVRFNKFDDDSKTSLIGAHVWDQLVKDGRAVKPESLDTSALLVLLRDELPRSLAETTALFWTNSRMPMLSGDTELRAALYTALTSRKLELVNAEGVVADIPDQARDLPIRSNSVSIRIPAPKGSTAKESGPQEPYGVQGEDGLDAASSAENPETIVGGSESTPPLTIERAQLWLKAQADLSDSARGDKVLAMLRRIVSIVDNDDLESIVITMDLVGNQQALKGLVEVAKPIEGVQNRLEDLPD